MNKYLKIKNKIKLKLFQIQHKYLLIIQLLPREDNLWFKKSKILFKSFKLYNQFKVNFILVWGHPVQIKLRYLIPKFKNKVFKII